MTRKKTLALFIAIHSIGFVNAQTTETKKVDVFDHSDDSNTSNNKSGKSSDVYCIKLNVYEFGRGVFAMSFENLITNKIGVEVSAGMTYRDFIFETWNKVNIPDAKVDIGYALAANVRFYPGKNRNFDGAYLSPEISYRTYNMTSDRSSAFQPNNVLDAGYSMFDLRIKLGYQYEAYWMDDIVTDAYIGFGWRNVSLNKIVEGSVTNPQTGGSETIYNSSKVSLTMPQILFGTKIGLPF